jgi:IS30 family transposase
MSHITKEQRYTISVMYEKNYSQKEIAEAINKDKSVVSRELKRNSDLRSGKYRSNLAHRKYIERLRNKPKKRYFTNEIRATTDELLRNDYSPEQIAGRLKLEGKPTVSHERIYQYVWDDKKQGGDLYKHLRRKGRKYRKRGNAKDTRGIIKDRVGIEHRYEIVDKKQRIGDLEIDTIIGRNHKGAILTINDRVSSKVWIAKLNGKNAEELAKMAVEKLMPIKSLIHTITGDNGKEFAEHKQISQQLGIDFYFARPYHSWERGANENTNGLIRQYFSKGASFESIDEQEIKRVEEKLNNRPRKKLKYLTPNEFFILNLSNKKVAFIT